MQFYKHLVLLSIILILFSLNPIISQDNVNSLKMKARASSTQESQHSANKSVDNDFSTRWGSKFSDPQWLEIDMGVVTKIVGVTLYWEAAYGKSYDILVSKDKNNWTKVYSEENGDGMVDDIYFKKTTARYIKIFGKERGTAWGFSLWEVSIKGIDEEIVLNASSSLKNSSASNVFDGNLESIWQSENNDNAWVEFEFKKAKHWGALFIDWGKDFPKSYNISISKDKRNWTLIYNESSGDGGLDKVYVNILHDRFIRISCSKSNNNKGFAIREIYLKPWEYVAMKNNLIKTRSITGWTAAHWKTFVGRNGSFGPEPYPHQVSFWVLDRSSQILFTPQTISTDWQLEEGRLPISIVKWLADEINVTTTIFTNKDEESKLLLNFARTTLKNNSQEKKSLSLYVVISPNPVKKRKGSKSINTIEYNGGNIVKINNKNGLFVYKKFDKPILNKLKGSDIKNWAGVKLLNTRDEINDSKGKAKGALVYHVNLKPGEQVSYDFVIPCHETRNREIPYKAISKLNYDDSIENVKEYWNNLIPMKLTLPDKRYSDCFYSSIYYILMLMSDTFELHPGPSDYNNFFLHDGVEMAEALDKVGLKEIVRKSLKHFNYKEGGGYVDELGGNIYAFYAHYRINKDKNWLNSVYPLIIEKCNLIKKIRTPQLKPKFEDTPYYGLLPKSVSQDNWKYKSYLYVDDWWALIGLKSAIKSANVLNKEHDIGWLTDEYNDLHKCLMDSFDKAMKRDNIDYIPGFADYWAPEKRIVDNEHRILGDTQMAWAHRPALYPGLSLGINVPFDKLKKSYRHYWDAAGKFSGYDGGWYVEYEKLFWGYNVKLAHPLIYLGMEDVALKNIEWSIKNQSCPGAWMEAMHSKQNEKGLIVLDKDGDIVGDIPHGWVAAHYVLLLRNMLFYENENKMMLLSCIPDSWLETGNIIEIKNAPTFFGNFDFRLESHLNEDFIKIKLNCETPPVEGYILKLPVKKGIKEVSINGNKWENFTENSISIPPEAEDVVIKY